MNDVHEMQANHADDLTLYRCIQILNADQERIFTQVLKHLQHQYRHEKENVIAQTFSHCTCSLAVLEEQENSS